MRNNNNNDYNQSNEQFEGKNENEYNYDNINEIDSGMKDLNVNENEDYPADDDYNRRCETEVTSTATEKSRPYREYKSGGGYNNYYDNSYYPKNNYNKKYNKHNYDNYYYNKNSNEPNYEESNPSNPVTETVPHQNLDSLDTNPGSNSAELGADNLYYNKYNSNKNYNSGYYNKYKAEYSNSGHFEEKHNKKESYYDKKSITSFKEKTYDKDKQKGVIVQEVSFMF